MIGWCFVFLIHQSLGCSQENKIITNADMQLLHYFCDQVWTVKSSAKSLTSSERIEEKEKLADSSADIERIEGFLKSVQLRQSWNQLQDVVLQILHRSIISQH